MTARYLQIKHKGFGVEFQVMHSTAPSYPPAIRPISYSCLSQALPRHSSWNPSLTAPLTFPPASRYYLLEPFLHPITISILFKAHLPATFFHEVFPEHRHITETSAEYLPEL